MALAKTPRAVQEFVLDETIKDLKDLHYKLEQHVAPILTVSEQAVRDQVLSVSGELAVLAHELAKPRLARAKEHGRF